MRWGNFHGVKNRKLFVAHLSGFWLRKILLDRPQKKIFPAETKKMEGTNGPDPQSTIGHAFAGFFLNF
jgi:hypothetical protein